MQTNIEFSDNILTVETFKDLENVIHDLKIGQLELSEPIRKVIIKNLNNNLEKHEVQDYLFSSQLKKLEAVDILDSGKGFCSDDGLVYQIKQSTTSIGYDITQIYHTAWAWVNAFFNSCVIKKSAKNFTFS